MSGQVSPPMHFLFKQGAPPMHFSFKKGVSVGMTLFSFDKGVSALQERRQRKNVPNSSMYFGFDHNLSVYVISTMWKWLPKTKGMDQAIHNNTMLNTKKNKQKMMEHTTDILIFLLIIKKQHI